MLAIQLTNEGLQDVRLPGCPVKVHHSKRLLGHGARGTADACGPASCAAAWLPRDHETWTRSRLSAGCQASGRIQLQGGGLQDVGLPGRHVHVNMHPTKRLLGHAACGTADV